MVAFIDILGFSERALGLEKESDLRRLDADVAMVQVEFEHRPVHKSPNNVHTSLRKEVLAFSDCILVSIAGESPQAHLQGTFDLWLSELWFIAIAQWNCVCKRIFLRGGVDLGLWYRSGSRLISPAMVEAYRLEHNVHVPVIAITDNLYEFFEKSEDRFCYADTNEPLSIFREHVDPETKKKYKFLDYLSVAISAIDWMKDDNTLQEYKNTPIDMRSLVVTEGWTANVNEALRHHRRLILDAYNNAVNENIRAKYKWLAEYQNDVIEGYGDLFRECSVSL